VRVRRADRAVLVERMFTDVDVWFAELGRLAAEPFMSPGRQQGATPSETCSMTTHLLDTNACIALINGTEVAVRRRFRRALGKRVPGFAGPPGASARCDARHVDRKGIRQSPPLDVGGLGEFSPLNTSRVQ